jgi:hypothetical protein
VSGESAAEKVGLPVKPFLYTLDQIAFLISIEERTLKTSYLFYQDRSVGAPPKNKIRAVNIAPTGETPNWRVAEREFVRWLRYKGFRYQERGWIK